LDDHVAIKEDLANVHWMVTSDFVVRHALVFGGVLIFKEALPDFVFQGSEIFLARRVVFFIRSVAAGP
jgi:hypothetical protein